MQVRPHDLAAESGSFKTGLGLSLLIRRRPEIDKDTIGSE